MDKYIGKLLDNRYEVLEIAGVGGMATIYKARCRVLNRFVAIKILKDEFAQDEEFRRRFYLESQAVAKLSHPNIVAVYDVSHTQGLEYIVMELVEGVTLKDYLQQKNHLSWQETLFFAQQIARALSHAHSRGIIHQDIKPQNVMITSEGAAKVTDFGIASFAANQETRVIQEAIGSVHYISPEQAKGSNIDYRTDLYSLGVVMYECLTGKLPFEGETALSIVMQHISAMPLMPSEVVGGIPRGMDEITMHAMCPVVARRYASADELYTDLQRLKTDPDATFDFAGEVARGEKTTLGETQPMPQYHEMPRAPQARPEYAPRPTPQKKTTQTREKDGPSSTVVAVIAVVAFAVIAVVIAGMLVFGGGSGSKDKLVVDNFEGMNIESIMNIDTGEINQEFAKFHFETKTVEDENKENGLIFGQDPKAGTKVTQGATITLQYYVGNTTVEEYTVPPLQGRDKKWVQETLERHNREYPKLQIAYEFKIEDSDKVYKDQVIRTDPGEGAKMKDGEKLIVYLSAGAAEELDLPNVVGDTIENATNKLTAFELQVSKTEVDGAEKAGTVVGQSPPANKKVKKGDTVTLEVSNGKAPETEQPPADPGTTAPDGGTPVEPPKSASVTLTVAIPPEAQESAHIVVRLDDGTVVYDDTKTKTGASVDVTITGSGNRFATVYVNDQSVGEQNVNFN